MLERVCNEATYANRPMIRFRNIQPNSRGKDYLYVRDGIHKFTKAGKPFITLFLQDVDGNVIPGYVFDIENFNDSGKELTQVIHSLAVVEWRENYLDHVGMTVIIEGIQVDNAPDAKTLAMFVGTAKEATEKRAKLTDMILEETGHKIALPMDICTTSYIDYCNGKVGGLAIHYYDVFNILRTYADHMDSKDRKQLFGTFVLYIYAHSQYMKAHEKGTDDINLVMHLMAKVENIMGVLQLGSGALEAIHIHFGYEPKDIFVRLIVSAVENAIRMDKELNLYNTLPISREGNAGYGTIRHYE